MNNQDITPDVPVCFNRYEVNQGMSLRQWYKGQILAGFCANPAIFSPNASCGWALCNCTPADLIDYAAKLADKALSEDDHPATPDQPPTAP